MKGLLLSSFLLLLSIKAGAIEPRNPLSLCERFLEGPDRSKCEEKMTQQKPDWYVASVCNSNFDDQLFYDCVALSKLGSFSPDKLETCLGDQYTDAARMTCIKGALTTPARSFQSTSPAAKKSSEKASQKKKN